MILALKKTTHKSGTGGGPPSQDLTPAEELALDLNKGRPVMEGIQGGTVTDSVPATETVCFIQGTYCSTTHNEINILHCLTLDFLAVSGNTLTLLDPPEDDPVCTFDKNPRLGMCCQILIQVLLYGRGKAHLQLPDALLQMRRLCHWTPEGMRYHVNFVEISCLFSP